MAAPKGNTNAAKSREFEQTLKRFCIQEDYKRLRQGVDQLLNKAAEGEQWALLLVRDTLDGKPAQAIEGTIEHEHTHEHRAVSETDRRIAELFGLRPGGDSPAAVSH